MPAAAPFDASEFRSSTLYFLEENGIAAPRRLVWSMRDIGLVLRWSTRKVRATVCDAGAAEFAGGRWYAPLHMLRAHLPELAEELERRTAAWGPHSVRSDAWELETRKKRVIRPSVVLYRSKRGVRVVGLVPVAEVARAWGMRTERVRRRLRRTGDAIQRGPRWYAPSHFLDPRAELGTRYAEQLGKLSRRGERAKSLTIAQLAREQFPKLKMWAGGTSTVWLLRCFADHLGVQRRRVPGRVLIDASDVEKLRAAINSGEFSEFADHHRSPIGKLGRRLYPKKGTPEYAARLRLFRVRCPTRFAQSGAASIDPRLFLNESNCAASALRPGRERMLEQARQRARERGLTWTTKSS